MKKFIALLLSLMMLLTLAACGEKGKTTDGGEDAVSTKLNIFMWGDYMSDDLVANFEKEYGVKVNLSYMNDNADSITKLTAGAGDGYDLIMTCDAYMESLIAGDYLESWICLRCLIPPTSTRRIGPSRIRAIACPI